jgi:hypothetical protein
MEEGSWAVMGCATAASWLNSKIAAPFYKFETLAVIIEKLSNNK